MRQADQATLLVVEGVGPKVQLLVPVFDYKLSWLYVVAGADLAANHAAGHVCWDGHDVMGGRPTGAVRVSLGHASSFADVYVLLRWV